MRDAIAAHLGEDITASGLRRAFSEENRVETSRILFESINLDRMERVCSSLYVTVVTCLAAGLSEQAAKVGLGLNVSSIISHSLFKVLQPLIPPSQPLMRFFARAACASLGILAAFRLEKSLLVWANCLLGADLMISAGELALGIRRSRSIDREDDSIVRVNQSALSRARTTCVWVLAGSGLFLQVMPGADMPVWMKGVLIGPRMFEYGLQALSVSMKGNDNRNFFV